MSEEKELNVEENSGEVPKSDMVSRFRKNPWMIATFVLGILFVVLFFSSYVATGNVVSGDEAGQELVNFLSENAGSEVTYLGYEEVSGLYKVSVEFQGEVYDLYSSKDGEFFIQGLVPMNAEEAESQQTNSQSNTQAQVTKSDLPLVELFIMTHCPYGTQAEKGFIPFMEALGDNIDAKIRFVHYFMHEPEETETPIQICIREEQEEKFIPYLKCFLEGNGVVDPNYGLVMEGKNSQECMKEVGVNEDKVQSCVDSEKWKEYYAVDSQLSQSYGVGGSPTLVINGVIASSGRSPSAYQSVACSSFNEVPEECSLTLDSNTPNPYFGWEINSQATATGSC